MADDGDLRAFLVVAFEHLKTQCKELSLLTAEVAALRDALIELGPRFADILEHHRRERHQAGSRVEDELVRVYDEIIQRVKGDVES